MMENPCVKPALSAAGRSIVPVCSEENGRGDNGISNSIEEVCISGWDKPIRGKVYYHPIDDDPEFLGCTKLIIPIKRVQPIRPETNLTISNEPMEMTTTFQREFGTPTMNFQNVKRNIRKYEPPSEPISSETEYRNIFYAKPIAPAKPFNPKEQELLDGSMEKLSLYQRTFKGFDHCQMKNSKPMNYAPKRPKLERAKFTGTSTTKDSYSGHFGVTRSDPIKPLQSSMFGLMCGHEMTYDTTQKREFCPKSAPKALLFKYQSDPYLIRPEKADMSTPISSMKRAFIPHHHVIPVCAFIPRRIPVRTDSPMTSDTTYKDDYWHRKRQEQYGRPDWSLRKAYKVPSEEMERDTTYDTQYKKPPQTAKTQSLKPKRVELEFGSCDVNPRETTVRSDYRAPPKGDYKGKSYMPSREYKKTDDYVDYLTTAQNAFKGVQGQRRLPFGVSRLAELQMRYKDKRMANRTLYREMFGVDYVFVPAKPLSPRDNDKVHCMYDIKSSETIVPEFTSRMTPPAQS